MWCSELLGQLRHAPAIDLLIQKMQDTSGDFLQQSAMLALARMNAAQLVPKLEAEYRSEIVNYRMRVADALGINKDPLGEQLLIRVLPRETDPQGATAAAMALCDLATTEGLEEVRQVVLEDRYDTTIADVKELLVTVSKMVGYQPPELEDWKAEVVSPDYRKKLRERFLGGFSVTEAQVDAIRRVLSGQGRQTRKTEPPPLGPADDEVTLPIRRQGPKIGRNDPCHCGSGKKYKKCCGA
jgi:hypothetical protein